MIEEMNRHTGECEYLTIPEAEVRLAALKAGKNALQQILGGDWQEHPHQWFRVKPEVQ